MSKSFPQLQEEKLRIQAGMELIEIYYGAGHLDKAAGVAGILRQLAPENTDILYTAYRIYSDLAGESMLSMAMLAPKSARMHQMMAQEMARQGNTEGAIAHYREAVKMDPQLPGLRFELAEALNLSASASDQEQVEKEYQAALADNPFDEKAECRLGEIALRASDLESALAHYKRALELQPNDAEASLGVGKTLTPDAPAGGCRALPETRRATRAFHRRHPLPPVPGLPGGGTHRRSAKGTGGIPEAQGHEGAAETGLPGNAPATREAGAARNRTSKIEANPTAHVSPADCGLRRIAAGASRGTAAVAR